MHTNQVAPFKQIELIGVFLGGTIIYQAQVEKLFDRAKHSEDWQSFTEALFIYNTEIGRHRFRKFYDEITSTTTATRLHKTLTKGIVDEAVALRKPNGIFKESEEERDRFLIETQIPDSIPLLIRDTNKVSNSVKVGDSIYAQMSLHISKKTFAFNLIEK